tara:strand:+ start:1186 stop:2163 length:978 start_codon:yes stop_codon:yes gene_type:complete
MILKQYKLKALAGDASSRKFFRKFYDDKKSKVIVVSKKEKFKNLILYAAINNFLIKNKILAPKIYKINIREGFMEISDFGDKNFHKVMKKKKSRIFFYKKIIDLLFKIQKIKPTIKIKTSIHRNHKFQKYSLKILHSESDLFFNWYLKRVIGKKRATYIKKILKPKLNAIYKKLNFKNNIFVHRDFHVSNLMRVNNKIGVLDSQDAIIGNPSYDLVSLIDDVRIVTSNKLKNQIYDYYIEKSSLINQSNKINFLEDFYILSIQRNLKIIGIFSRLFLRDKKKQYLKLISYCWKLIEHRYKHESFEEIKLILDEYIPKKIRKLKSI